MLKPFATNAVRRSSGYALPLVLVLVVLLGIAFATALTALRSNVAVTSDMIARRRAFYACDGLSRDIAHIAQEYIVSTGNVTSTGMRDFVCTTSGSAAGCSSGLPNIVPPGFDVENFAIGLTGTPSPRPIPNGAFSGMNALQTDIKLTVAAKKQGSDVRCETTQTLTLGSIGMFQFFVFSDLKLTWYPDPESVVRGRMHVNGDVCVSSTVGGLYLQNLTSAERAMSGRNPACLALDNAGSKVHVWKGGTTCPASNFPGTNTSLQPLNSTAPSSAPSGASVDPCFTELVGEGSEKNDHGSIPASASGFSTWADYALATWNRGVVDVDHKIPKLRLPVQGVAQVQLSRLASDNAAGAQDFSNVGTSRLFIDPVRAADPTDVAAEKIACKADVRIINGVWYLKDAAATDCDWPGTPIWSDHPGRFTVAVADQPDEVSLVGTRAVGQADLHGARGWNTSTNADEVPTMFSYYRFGVKNDGFYGELIYDPAQVQPPVVSYGAMKNRKIDSPDDADTDIDAEVVPAFWVDNGPKAAAPNAQDLLAGSVPGESCTTAAPAATVEGETHFLGLNEGGCGTTTQIKRHRVLEAARTGFLDPQIMDKPNYETVDVRIKRSRVLPLNFDVRAFRAALKTCANGELGSYFPGTCSGTGRTFNGIVYVTNTWTDSLRGFGAAVGSGTFAGGAAVWPQQGTHENASSNLPNAVVGTPVTGAGSPPLQQPRQAGRFNSAVARPSLPYQLCTNDPQLTSISGNPGTFSKGGTTVWAAEMVRPDTSTPLPFVTFKHVPCADWTIGGNEESGARANVVRVIHAGVVGRDDVIGDPLPRGLSLATNQPAYLWGDINDRSVPDLAPTSTPQTPWVPFMIAGDQVRFLSRNWNDATTPWGKPSVANNGGNNSSSSNVYLREAIDTVYTLQNFSGHPQGAGNEFNGGFENFPGFLEDWKGTVKATVNGSFVVGFSPVYLRTHHAGRKRTPPARPWSYDHHLDFPANQPPGAPHFEVFAIKDWLR